MPFDFGNIDEFGKNTKYFCLDWFVDEFVRIGILGHMLDKDESAVARLLFIFQSLRELLQGKTTIPESCQILEKLAANEKLK